MGIFKVIRNTNDELQYLYNVLNYTMGIHTDYDKRYSPNVDIYNAYEQFLSVKNISVRQAVIRHFILLSCMMQDRLGVIIMSGRNQ